jgi:protocatechuate 3,4-dioxygenase beta subunit
MFEHERFTRRHIFFGAAGAAYLTGSGHGERLWGLLARAEPAGTAMAADAPELACVLSPAKTEGPYFVDERLNRSDIRADTSSGSIEAGVPLRLTMNAYDAGNNCAPVQGATVDIWHANARGAYSDVSANGTVGQKWLRGSQNTDASGAARFLTIYPGWYSGRAIHIHFKIRKFDGSATTYEFTSQLFFEESITNAVLTQSPYSARGLPNTRNSQDSIYGSDGSRLTVAVAPDGSGGYAGTFNVGLSGLSRSGGADATVQASLSSARFARGAAGRRVLTLALDVDETVSADVRVVRGTRSIVRRRYSSLRAGIRRLTVVIGSNVGAGPAQLRLTLTDAAGNEKVVSRSLRVPAR